eukprot:scaffold92533_cov69-Phaeocystis_antarctica.AAC.2
MSLSGTGSSYTVPGSMSRSVVDTVNVSTSPACIVAVGACARLLVLRTSLSTVCLAVRSDRKARRSQNLWGDKSGRFAQNLCRAISLPDTRGARAHTRPHRDALRRAQFRLHCRACLLRLWRVAGLSVCDAAARWAALRHLRHEAREPLLVDRSALAAGCSRDWCGARDAGALDAGAGGGGRGGRWERGASLHASAREGCCGPDRVRRTRRRAPGRRARARRTGRRAAGRRASRLGAAGRGGRCSRQWARPRRARPWQPRR